MVDKKIVAKMIELYVSRKESFIMMTRDGNIFMPKIGNRFMRLSVSNIERHLEHEYAISVFAVEAGSKFICMDIDHGGLATVQKVMASLLDIGFEHNMLHISTSGGKGFHIEIFFTAIVPYASLTRLYKHVLDSTGATENMIEMRPTHKQGIKLPLSIHPRTGNICWFVDHELFEPIERQDYILEIVPVAVEVFEMIIKDLPEPIETTRIYKGSGEWKPVEWGNLLEPAEEGTRHNRMVQIASALHNHGVDSETCWEQLHQWHDAQGDGYCRSSYAEVLRDINQIVRWAYKDSSPMMSPDKIVVFAKEMQCVMLQPRRSTRVIYFLLMCLSKTSLRISQVEMSRILSIGPVTIIKEISFLSAEKMIKVHPGQTKRTSNGFLCKQANQYSTLKCEIKDQKKRALQPTVQFVVVDKTQLLVDFYSAFYSAIQHLFGSVDLQRQMTPAEHRSYQQHINASAQDAPEAVDQDDQDSTSSLSSNGCMA